MARLTFTQDNQPTPEEFEQMLAQATAHSNPVDDLLEVSNELWEYEQKHGMTSAEFYEQFRQGTLDDTLQHCMDWAFAFEVFSKIKRAVETALMREAMRREIWVAPDQVESEEVTV